MYTVTFSQVKVFRIIPKFRILRLTFHGKSASKYWMRQIMVASLIYAQHHLYIYIYIMGPLSAVCNVSGNRCESDCRSRCREFDPGPVPYFRGDWVWNNFYGHSPPFPWIIREGLLSVTSESMCTKYWLTACSSLPRKKCGKVNWPSRHDHSCWLGT